MVAEPRTQLDHPLVRRPAPEWIPVLLSSGILLLFVSQTVMGQLSAAVRYPGSTFTAQFTTHAPTLAAHFRTLEAQGTLDLYVRMQWVDFGFITGLAVTTLLAPVIFARLQARGSWLYRLNAAAVPLMLLAPLADLAETVILLALLDTPSEVSAPLATARAACSALKYAGAALGLAALAVNLTVLTRRNLRRG